MSFKVNGSKSVDCQRGQYGVVEAKSTWNGRVIGYIPVVSTFHGIVLIVKGIIDKIKGGEGNNEVTIKATYHLTSGQKIVKGCLELVPIVNIVACAIFDKVVYSKNEVPQQPQQPQQKIQPKVQLTTEGQKVQPSLESSQQLQLKRAIDETDIDQVIDTNCWDFSKIVINKDNNVAVYNKIKEALTCNLFEKVQVLILPKAENFTPEQQVKMFSAVLSRRSEALTKLVIDGYCSKIVYEETGNILSSFNFSGFNSFTNMFPNLKKLSLEGCFIVDEENLFPLEGKYGKLEELNIMDLKLSMSGNAETEKLKKATSQEFRALCNGGKFENLKVLKIDHISCDAPVFTSLGKEGWKQVPCKLPSLEKLVYNRKTKISGQTDNWGGILAGLKEGHIKEGLEVEFISDHKEQASINEHAYFFNYTDKVVAKKLESLESPTDINIGDFNKVLKKQHNNLTYIEVTASEKTRSTEHEVIKGLLSCPCPKVEKLVFRYHGKESGSAGLGFHLNHPQVSALFFGTLFNIPTADVIKNKENSTTTTWTEKVAKIKTQTEELEKPGSPELKYPTTKLVYDKLIVGTGAPQIFPVVTDIEILSQADTPIPNASADCLVKYLESGKTNLRSIKMETVFSNDDAQNIADLSNICYALINGPIRPEIEKFDIKGMFDYRETTALFAEVIINDKLPSLKKPILEEIVLESKGEKDNFAIFKLMVNQKQKIADFKKICNALLDGEPYEDIEKFDIPGMFQCSETIALFARVIEKGKLPNLKELTLDGINPNYQNEGDNSAIFKLIEGGKLSNLEVLTLKDCDIFQNQDQNEDQGEDQDENQGDITSLKNAVKLGYLSKLKKFTTIYTDEKDKDDYFRETDLDDIFGEDRKSLESLEEIKMYCGEEEEKPKNIYSWSKK